MDTIDDTKPRKWRMLAYLGRRHGVWLWTLVGLFVLTGCSPSRFLALQMVDAPNRVPEFVKPEGRVWLQWPEGLLERFPTGTNRVDGVDLRWVRVDAADYGASFQVQVRTHRGRAVEMMTMDARLPEVGLPPIRRAVGTAYVVHGYGVDLESMFPWGLFLAEAGWRVVLMDLPGHGRSGGRRVTFGVREVDMLRELRRQLETDGEWDSGPVIAVGHSMGAAVALRWGAADPGLAGVVALGAYAEFAPAVLRLRDDYARWVPRVWVRRAAARVPGLLGVEPARLDTVNEIRGVTPPALLIASAADVVTPPEDTAMLNAECGPGSRMLIVEGATHETLPYAFAQHGRWVREWLAGVLD